MVADKAVLVGLGGDERWGVCHAPVYPERIVPSPRAERANRAERGVLRNWDTPPELGVLGEDILAEP